VDVVVGFDISTHLQGQPLFQGHPRLESNLPKILEDLTSIRGVSCGAGAEAQVSLAFKVNNDQEFPAKFQIYQKAIFDSLLQVTVSGPAHLNAQFLQSLWDTFEDKSPSRGQVPIPCPSLCSSSPSRVSPSTSPLFFVPLSSGATHLFRWPPG
jgi:collagen type VI alpha